MPRGGKCFASTRRSRWTHTTARTPNRLDCRSAGCARAFARQLPDAGLFDALVADLTTERWSAFAPARRSGARRITRRCRPTSARRATGCARRLVAKPFEPPSRKELAPDAVARQAVRFLCDTGEAMEFGEDLVLLEENYRRMKTIIVRTIRAAGPSTTSELRQVLGTTRRVLIPVLEVLDRDGITRREGDRRALR